MLDNDGAVSISGLARTKTDASSPDWKTLDGLPVPLCSTSPDAPPPNWPMTDRLSDPV